MVKKSIIETWELPKTSLNANDDGNVILISCKNCKEYYVDDGEGREELNKFTGRVKDLVVKWINRSHIIKKNNAHEHIQQANYHADVTRRLKERAGTKNCNSLEQNKQPLSIYISWSSKKHTHTSQITSAH